MKYACSSINIWTQHEILSNLKKKISKIDAYLKMEKFTSANYIYMFSLQEFRRRSFPWQRLATDHVYAICRVRRSRIFPILRVLVHQFTCFFFLNSLKFHADSIFRNSNVHKWCVRGVRCVRRPLRQCVRIQECFSGEVGTINQEIIPF